MIDVVIMATMAIPIKITVTMGRTLTAETKITVTLVTISTTENRITVIVLVTMKIITTIEDEILTTAIIIAATLITREKKQLDKPIRLTITHDRKTPSHLRIKRVKEGGVNNYLVRSVENAPKTCKIDQRWATSRLFSNSLIYLKKPYF